MRSTYPQYVADDHKRRNEENFPLPSPNFPEKFFILSRKRLRRRSAAKFRRVIPPPQQKISRKVLYFFCGKKTLKKSHPFPKWDLPLRPLFWDLKHVHVTFLLLYSPSDGSGLHIISIVLLFSLVI